MKTLLITLFCLFIFGLLSAENADWFWHEATPLDHTTRYFRMKFTLPVKPERSAVAFAVDDIGVIHVNGKRQTQRQSLETTVRNLASDLVAGENVIAVEAANMTGAAGIIMRAVFTFADGEMLALNGRFKSNDQAPEGWQSPGFDDSAWQKAIRLGSCNMAPWTKLVNHIPFLDLPLVPAPKPELLGKVMVEDFSTISSWRGAPIRGGRPGAHPPFDFNFGSVPDARRDDGWAGILRFDFSEPNGEVSFEKNAVFLREVVPMEIEFSADTRGHAGEIFFTFSDRMKQTVKSKPIRLSGEGWNNYRMKLDSETVPGFEMLRLPLSIRRLHFRAYKAGKGEIMLDDIAFRADVSAPEFQTMILPVYEKLAAEPGKPVAIRFQLRNGLPEAAGLRLLLTVSGVDGEIIARREGETIIAPEGMAFQEFRLSPFDRKGAYRLELTVNNGKSVSRFTGWIGVFTPNNGRLNHTPMYFGVEDQEIQTAPYEAELHAGWMKQLGTDIVRAGVIGTRLEEIRDDRSGYDALLRLWKPYLDAGMLLIFEYGELVPRWTLTEAGQKKWNVLEVSPSLFQEHIARVGDFIRTNPQIRYFEWFNEPDLHGYSGSVEDYMASLRLLYPVLKKHAPDLQVMTGGIIVGYHPRTKANFLRTLYLDNHNFYDIAAFHGHDDYGTYKNYIPRIKALLGSKGITKGIANTEAGFRSQYDSPELFYVQARTLVQKIAHSKHQGAEFYIWFMLQDYWDKFLNGDDSFGLVTVENQPKPSFLAYNELIRQLADTVPGESAELDPRLETLAFDAKQGKVLVNWPRGNAKKFPFALRSRESIRMVDLYGNEELLVPANGVIFLNAPEEPFYLRVTGPVEPAGTPLSAAGNPVLLPGERKELTLVIRNPYSEPVHYVFKTDRESRRGSLKAGGAANIALAVSVSPNEKRGVTIPCSLELKQSSGTVLYRGKTALSCPIALPIAQTGVSIRLNRAEQVRELMFDTKTPKWAGPEDLSAAIDIRRRGNQLLFDAEVTDNDHSTPGDGAYIWSNDCIQIAVSKPDGSAHHEFTVSGNSKGAATVWCHISPGDRKNGNWPIPATVTRTSGKTVYHFEVPLERLELSGNPGELFRLSLLVNDNDGGRNLRHMEFNGGIQPRKNPELFGWAQFQ